MLHEVSLHAKRAESKRIKIYLKSNPWLSKSASRCEIPNFAPSKCRLRITSEDNYEQEIINAIGRTNLVYIDLNAVWCINIFIYAWLNTCPRAMRTVGWRMIREGSNIRVWSDLYKFRKWILLNMHVMYFKETGG